MSPPRRPGRLRRAATVGLALVLLAGCTGGGDDLKTVSEADVTKQVRLYAEEVVALVGKTTLASPAERASKCENAAGDRSDRAFYIEGSYQLAVPVSEHIGTLAQLRDRWNEMNYTVTNQVNAPDGTGTLSVRNPNDGVTITLESAKPPEAFILLVRSACFQRPNAR